VACHQEPDGHISFACAGSDFKQSSVHAVRVLPVNKALLQTHREKGCVKRFEKQGDKMYQTRDRHGTPSLKPQPAVFLTRCMVISNC